MTIRDVLCIYKIYSMKVRTKYKKRMRIYMLKSPVCRFLDKRFGIIPHDGIIILFYNNMVSTPDTDGSLYALAITLVATSCISYYIEYIFIIMRILS